ncbi:MAG: VWA domain-containing protein [Gemmataceae bacterium]|nr:VWA domain-containing protein [Gemmataceae bacterium]
MRYAAVVALLLALPGAGRAQEADYEVEIVPDSVVSSIKDGVRTVRLSFTVKRVGPGSGGKEKIRVFEDKVLVWEKDLVASRAQPLTAVLAIDVSGSMARSGKMEEAKAAAKKFLDTLDPRADVGLVLFDHEVKLALPPAKDRAALRRAIDDAKPQGGTAYHDATIKAVDLLKGAGGRKAVILMTDGMDTNSRKPLKDAVEAAQIGELPVYTVGIGQPGKNDPVTTVLVLDRSGSMMGRADDSDKQRKIEALKVAASRFVDLMRRGARTTVLPFSDTIDVPEAFSNDAALLKDRIERLVPKGGTLLFDATFSGVETLAAADPPGKRAVVVLTDGKDEAPGSRRSAELVIERAVEAKMPLYMLGLGKPGEIDDKVMQKMAKETGGEYYYAGSEKKLLELFENLSIQLHDDGIDEESLGRLAKETGGKYYHAKDLDKLALIYEQLAESLNKTVEASFASKRAAHDGTARGIDVKVVTEDGREVSKGGEATDVARGIVVPQMSYWVYLAFLGGLGALLAVPGNLKRLFKAFGGS